MGRAAGAWAIFLIATTSLVLTASASASEFKATEYPADVVGEQESPSSASLSFGGVTVKCSEFLLTGDLVEEGEMQLEVFPTFSGCMASGLSATIAMEGCGFRGRPSPLEVELSCELNAKITVATLTCEIEITREQELGSGIKITEQGSSPQFLDVEVALTGIHYKKLKDGLICPLNGVGTGTDGALGLNGSVGAFLEEVQVDLFVE